MKKQPLTRSQLIARLRTEAIKSTGVRYTLWTVYNRETRKNEVRGLERAGRRSRFSFFSSGGYITHLEPDTFTEEEVANWPARKTKYSFNLSYIGAKKILELMGEPISKADIRKARKERRDEDKARRVSILAREANKKFETLQNHLDELVKLGTLTEKQVLELSDKFVALDLPTNEEA